MPMGKQKSFPRWNPHLWKCSVKGNVSLMSGR
ncbi:hypothetical protein CsSME_00041537 [Camellia sinensis var. sinensis]